MSISVAPAHMAYDRNIIGALVDYKIHSEKKTMNMPTYHFGMCINMSLFILHATFRSYIK